ncbi:MAG: zinc-finger domain-containing protein [Gammaproteobacteria bacterium]|nr:zinc-finger domain-containing protein [Gammaproteobacteria bacterium]
MNMQNDPPSPNKFQPVEVMQKDLPVSCPLPSMPLWNAHPKVYLPLHKTGRSRCPYCGTLYISKPQ